MDFQTAVRTVLSNYVTFTGRAQRSQYWWFALFSFGTSLILNVVDGAIFGPQTAVLSALWSLAILLPSIAVGARRLHDLDRSGWWLLVAFVPILGALLLIYWFIQRGTEGPNQYGPDPLAGTSPLR